MPISRKPYCNLAGDQVESCKLSHQVKQPKMVLCKQRKVWRYSWDAWELQDQVSAFHNPAPWICSELEAVSIWTCCACMALLLQGALTQGGLSLLLFSTAVAILRKKYCCLFRSLRWFLIFEVITKCKCSCGSCKPETQLNKSNLWYSGWTIRENSRLVCQYLLAADCPGDLPLGQGLSQAASSLNPTVTWHVPMWPSYIWPNQENL